MGFLGSSGGTGRVPREFHSAEQDRNTERTGYTQGQNTHSSIFPFPGGEGSISAWIVDKIPEHDTYVEVFGGGFKLAVVIDEETGYVTGSSVLAQRFKDHFETIRAAGHDPADYTDLIKRGLYQEYRNGYYWAV